ncbi:MAG TPA: hypothetical protein DEH78_31685 [Solibacterales bacterium]|nr:hypothetical protein [Bryobacterales bacterium]
MTRLAFLLLAGALALAAQPRLFFSKTFPGSTPAYVEIVLEKDGACVYREDPKDEAPLKFKLSPSDTAAMFDLAEKLDRFQRPLESGLNVAKMGEKVFRWEEGETRHEQKFNYSIDETAKALHEWFEKISETEQRLMHLERSVKFDRLGVNQAILYVEAAWDKKRLVAVEQFIPLLERVVKNSGYLNMARERARYLVETFRGPGKAE